MRRAKVEVPVNGQARRRIAWPQASCGVHPRRTGLSTGLRSDAAIRSAIRCLSCRL